MAENRADTKHGWIDRLYGGLHMSWPVVVLLAAASAVLTAVFLILPVFKGTSFERMGVHLEAWIFLAVLIMANCKNPLESALKVLVFFLISQPLIYLIQVPFTVLGWGIFTYYKHWFILTLLTFPAAFAGWYITKRNWLSALILAPVLAFLGITAWQNAVLCLHTFPRLLLCVLFCLLQIVLYAAAFLSSWVQRLVLILIPAAAAAIFAFSHPQINTDGLQFLPGDPVLTEAAVVETGEDAFADITIGQTGESSMVRVRAAGTGSMDFLIRDGEREYPYRLEVYVDGNGYPQTVITEGTGEADT